MLLNKGFRIAVNKSIGSINIRPILRAFFPFKYSAYEKAHTSDTARETGCIKNMENPITVRKYKKVTSG
jgi:hypothetical protein